MRTPAARRALITALAFIAGAVTAIVIAACSSSAFSGVGSTAQNTRPHSAHRSRVTPARTAGATATTATQPQVTAVATHPVTSSTTGTGTTSTASQLPGYKQPVIQLGDMNTSEQFILGDLYALALKHEGYTVVISPNIGSTQTSVAALQQGSLMLFPEYLNTWDSDVVHHDGTFRSLENAWETGNQYAQRHGWELLDPTPFSNTIGVAVSAQYARTNGLSSLTQLKDGPWITIGWPPEPTTLLALQKLESAYGFTPAVRQSIDIGAQYGSLTAGRIQAAYVTTTDPQLTESGYVLLRDPKQVFGFGNVVPVTTAKVINEEGPAFEQTIDRVSALLTQSAIRGLNYQVAVDHQDAQTVAEEFLQGNGILPATTYAPVTTTTSTTATSPTSTSPDR